jgi:hypothetical protein
MGRAKELWALVRAKFLGLQKMAAVASLIVVAQQRERARQAVSSGVVQVTGPRTLPLQAQGDLSLYTVDAILDRMSASRNPRVTKAIRQVPWPLPVCRSWECVGVVDAFAARAAPSETPTPAIALCAALAVDSALQGGRRRQASRLLQRVRPLLHIHERVSAEALPDTRATAAEGYRRPAGESLQHG